MGITSLFWDRMASRYHNQGADYEHLHNQTVDLLKKHLHKTDLVLDYGCATGSTAFKIANEVEQVHGIDFSPKMIAEANNRLTGQGVQNVRFNRTTIFDRNLGEGSYDVVLALGILHLLRNPHRVIRRIHDLLKPGGMFISATACKGERRTVPILMNMIGFLPSLIGLLPSFNFPDIPQLERSISQEKYQIMETKTHYFTLSHENTFLVSRYITAKKSKG